MRPLSGGRFAVTVVWRLAAFVALSLAGPFIATTIQKTTECTGTEGACAAISVGTGALLRPLILVLLALALLRPCWRRMKAVGMWGVAGFLVPRPAPPRLAEPDRLRPALRAGLVRPRSPQFGLPVLHRAGDPDRRSSSSSPAPRPDRGDSLFRRHGMVGRARLDRDARGRGGRCGVDRPLPAVGTERRHGRHGLAALHARRPPPDGSRSSPASSRSSASSG